MPSATAFFPDLTPYFLLDGTRNITGPTTIINNVPLLASDVLTIRGAAGQTGKLLTLETSALADVFTVDNDGKLLYTTNLPPVLATQTYGDRRTLTLTNNPASIVPTDFGNSNGIALSITQPSDSTIRTVYGINQTILMAGRFRQAYGNGIYVENSSAIAANGMSASQISTYHIGSGLMGVVNGQETYTYVTGPVTTHNGAYFYADNRGAATRVNGLSVSANHATSAITNGLTGAYIEAVLASGSAASVIGLDVAVTGAGSSSTYALRTTGGNILATGPTLTGSAATSLLSLAQTWNTSGTPTAILLNVTNTASNSNSQLIALQASSATRFAVRADGTTFIANGFYAGTSTAATTRYLTGSMLVTSSQGAGVTFSRLTHNNGNIALDILSNSHVILQQTAGNVGIGTATPAATLDIVGTAGAQFRLRDVTTNAANKTGYIQVGHYTNAEEDVALIGATSSSGANIVAIGGGSGSLNAATQIIFYAAGNNTTTTGTARLTLQPTLLTIADGLNIAVNTTTGTKWGTGITQKQSWWNATPVIQNTGWSTSAAFTDLKSFDPTAATLDDLRRVVGTLIDTFKSYGLLGA